uniref:Uncharacterized protein n=1 Tax=Thermomicrobium roseum TaxID=500 RepID=A0A7C5VXV1_THERO
MASGADWLGAARAGGGIGSLAVTRYLRAVAAGRLERHKANVVGSAAWLGLPLVLEAEAG